MRLLIVGNADPIHVGAHLLQAAQGLGLDVELCDSACAYAGPLPLRKWNWVVRGHRPTRLEGFGRQVLATCQQFKPEVVLTTGLAPLGAATLANIRRSGALLWNYLTDDPWNPAHGAPWFIEALPLYDQIFSTRRANLADLKQAGCQRVAYLQFAYNPAVHYPEQPKRSGAEGDFDADVLFAGGADAERIEWIAGLVEGGVRVALYGGYWERNAATRNITRGHADTATIRHAVGRCKIALCLVRRANRDGHVMRSFEMPAMRACMLTEDTSEHREVFGADGEAVVYFNSAPQMLEKLRRLLDRPAERERLACAAHQVVTKGGHSYRDRLKSMLEVAGMKSLAE